MKKLLISTAVVTGFAGAAMADAHLGVSLSGSATLAMKQNGADDAHDNTNWFVYTSTSLDVAMMGETDNGLEFGASFSIGANSFSDDSGSTDANSDDAGFSSIYIGNDTAKLTYADVDGASPELTLAGSYDAFTYSIAHDFGDQTDTGDNSTVVGFGYSVDALALSFEYGLDSSEFMAAATYEVSDTLTLGISYDDDSDDQEITASAAGSIDALTYSVALTDSTAAADILYNVSLGYTVDALSFSASTKTTAGESFDQYAFGIDYDLGGGATLFADYVADDEDTSASGDDQNYTQFGIALTF